MDQLSKRQKPGWDETDSRTFIQYGRYFIPDRELVLDIICQLLPGIQKQLNVLELCSGSGLLAEALLDRYPNLTLSGLDGSQEMINFTRENLPQYGSRFSIKKFDLEKICWDEYNGPFDAVISSLCVHHLDDDQKAKLFLDIYDQLGIGGSIIIFDLIQPMSPSGAEIAAKLWDSAVLERALQADNNPQAYKTFGELKWNLYRYPDTEGIDKPSSLFQQLKWLEQAGFTFVDVYWMNAGHAVFGGIKG
jgi:ubiquinone/menaquinone biosynthesis C-methylase UbiE